MQHIARYCKTLHDIARYCMILQDIACKTFKTLQHIARYCKALQDIARYFKTLQDIARHCKILQEVTRCYKTLLETKIFKFDDRPEFCGTNGNFVTKILRSKKYSDFAETFRKSFKSFHYRFLKV